MKNNELTKQLFEIIAPKTKTAILQVIARDYGITEKEAEEEVIGDEAESILDYLKGTMRASVWMLIEVCRPEMEKLALAKK